MRQVDWCKHLQLALELLLMYQVWQEELT